MYTEEFIKNSIDEYFNKFKEGAEKKGLVLDKNDEMFFKSGALYGVAIAGLALVNIDIATPIILGEEE